MNTERRNQSCNVWQFLIMQKNSNQFYQLSKNKNLPDDVKKTVKNRRKEMLEKLSYSQQSLKSICAKEFSYVASSHLAWYKQENSFNDERDKIQRIRLRRKTRLHCKTKMVISIIPEEMSDDKIDFPPSKKRLLPKLVHSEGGKRE